MSNKEEVVLNLTDDELLTYMKIAHDMDITFNQFVELALTTMIEKYQSENAQ